MTLASNTDSKIAITGIGIISPCGIGIESFRESILAGRGGIGPLTTLAPIASPGRIGAEVKDFTEKSAKATYLKSLRKNVKVMCREIQMGVAAASLGLTDSGLEPGQIESQRIGVDFGANLMFTPPDVLVSGAQASVDESEVFQVPKWGSTGMQQLEPLWLLKYLPNMPACHIAIHASAHGPSNSLTHDEASGILAIGEACRILQRGQADVMIAGSTGTRVQPMKSLHANLWDQLANPDENDVTHSMKPFDKNRSGQVIGEGAGSVILESASHAQGRGARIYGYVAGTGASCVVGKDSVPNRRRALANAIQAALRDAKLSPEDIGSINANGLASQVEDIEEYGAFKDVFGDHLANIPVTAPKSFLGNSGSGCGILELAASIVALRDQQVPVTLGFEVRDPDCPLNVVHGSSVESHSGYCLSVNVTRIAQAGAIIVEVPKR